MYELTHQYGERIRTVLFRDIALAVDTVERFIATDTAWFNLSPELWGNQDLPQDEWQNYLWQNLDATNQAITITPIKVQDCPKAAMHLLRIS